MVHVFVWLKEPVRRTHLLFFIAALSVAAITPFEWLMVRAQTPEQFGTALRWVQVGETMSAPIGIVSPWALIPQLSAWVLLLYVVHASFRIWRKANRQERRGVLILAVATMIFVIAAAGQGALILTGVIISPPFISLPFLAIILAMSFELSQDVLRATHLARVVESNEERLALAQEAADIGTFDWDIQTGKLLWNENLESIYGFRRGGFGGRSEDWQERVHPEDLSHCETEITEAIREKRSGWQSEYRMFRADTNEMRWIYEKARLFYDDDGKPTLAIVY